MEFDCEFTSREKVVSILQTIEELNHFNDVDAILDNILLEARKLTNADAGSIFLVENDRLHFQHVHNQTLFSDDKTYSAHYENFSIPIDDSSIVGYVALTKEILVIDDAYDIPADKPYSFNRSFDEKSGYRTQSILTIPLKTFENKLVGVMELINAKNEAGKTIPFSQEYWIYAPLLANNAAVVISRGIMTRELILRMMKMAELRDPSETGAHVQRVGAYSAEIYKRWAMNKKIGPKEIKRDKDLIRIAAMLHDVGKVGISDNILKKPARLTPDEFDIMKWHTVFGAQLFINNTSPLDQMSRDIALNHHERWSGGGYPGRIDDLFSPDVCIGEPKNGEEIPITARITSLADVFDALGSKRSYKEPWPSDRILNTISEESGKQFDPDVVEAFFQILDVIKAIRDKFNDDR